MRLYAVRGLASPHSVQTCKPVSSRVARRATWGPGLTTVVRLRRDSRTGSGGTAARSRASTSSTAASTFAVLERACRCSRSMRLSVTRGKPARCASWVIVSPAAFRWAARPGNHFREGCLALRSQRIVGSTPLEPHPNLFHQLCCMLDFPRVVRHAAVQGRPLAGPPENACNFSAVETGFGSQQQGGRATKGCQLRARTPATERGPAHAGNSGKQMENVDRGRDRRGRRSSLLLIDHGLVALHNAIHVALSIVLHDAYTLAVQGAYLATAQKVPGQLRQAKSGL
jgi:hypothetical protein